MVGGGCSERLGRFWGVENTIPVLFVNWPHPYYHLCSYMRNCSKYQAGIVYSSLLKKKKGFYTERYIILLVQLQLEQPDWLCMPVLLKLSWWNFYFLQEVISVHSERIVQACKDWGCFTALNDIAIGHGYVFFCHRAIKIWRHAHPVFVKVTVTNCDRSSLSG